jgi:hypothetical protein
LYRYTSEAAIDALIAAAGDAGSAAATSSARLTANWRLVWSSEQETLFLLEKWPASEAYQTIDVDAATLGNNVVFANGNAFVVDSDIEVEGTTRVNFQFTSARRGCTSLTHFWF